MICLLKRSSTLKKQTCYNVGILYKAMGSRRLEVFCPSTVNKYKHTNKFINHTSRYIGDMYNLVQTYYHF